MQLTEQETENLLTLLQSEDESNILLGLTILEGFEEIPRIISDFLSIPRIKKAYKAYKENSEFTVSIIKKYNKNMAKLNDIFKSLKDLLDNGTYTNVGEIEQKTSTYSLRPNKSITIELSGIPPVI